MNQGLVIEQPSVIPIVFPFAFNTSGIAAGIKIGSLPKNCYGMLFDVYVDTAFNPSGSGTINLGFANTGIEYINAQDVKVAGKFSSTRWSNNITWPLAADREVWLKYVETGTGASQGAGRIVILAMKKTL